MRAISTALQTHLDSGTTTLCNCWRLRMQSGETLGFTDHDLPLSFDGTTFEAQAGFTGSEIESSLGFSVDNMEAKGALQSTRLDETRLRRGDFDHAEVELWRVNWSDVTQRVLLRKGHLGEVKTGGGAFEVEVRGLSHLLNHPKGRIYQFACDAELGDERCGVNLSISAFSDGGSVASVNEAELVLNGVAFADDWATRGTIVFLSGEGVGKTLRVKRHRLVNGQTRVSLWATPPFAVAPGDAVTLRAGCDKQFGTCRNKFANGVNYRGFPHMPGNDFVFSYAKEGESKNDGNSRPLF
jgi:uncharacterized phage protein (TIGR02218 family)